MPERMPEERYDREIGKGENFEFSTRYSREENIEKIIKKNSNNFKRTLEDFIFINEIEPKREFNRENFSLTKIERELDFIQRFNFEREEVDERLDRYIINVLREERRPRERRWYDQLDWERIFPEPVEVRPQAAEPIARFPFHSETGLYLEPQAQTPLDLSVDGARVSALSARYSRIHFTPGGRAWFSPAKMTDSLSKAISGVAELVEAIDSGEVDVAPMIIGTTNKNMALIAQRMGFRVVDSCRTEDGKINRDLEVYTVAGAVEDIRQRIQEFQQSSLSERLSLRQARLNPRPAY
jgi:hypothetical protein